MTATLESVLGTDGLARFAEKGVVRHGLPPRAYTSDDFLALENERLFPNAWTFVEFAHDLAKPGDVVPVEVAGQPVLLVRDTKTEIRAFHNVCRHRGTILVEESKNVGRFLTCPYHTWEYGLDGALRSTPHFGGPHNAVPEGFDPARYGLKPVRCAVWHDWIFVNLSGDAPDFDAYVAPLAKQLDGVGVSEAKPVATIEFGEVKANWKFLMENFIEPYHVQFVHATTTEQPLRDHRTLIDGICLGSAVNISRPKAGGGRDTLAVDSRYLTLFPNFVLGYYVPDQLGVHLNVPLTAGRTRQRRVIYHMGEEAPAADVVASLRTLWGNVHREDHAIVERLQRGRASEVAADGGLLSPHWEDSVRRFQELVIEALHPAARTDKEIEPVG